MSDQGGLTRASFSNLGKIMYPEIGATKVDVIGHYIRAAPRMLRFLEGRALVMNRFPDGVGKEGFYEKDAPKGAPDWVRIFTKYSETARRDVNYVVGGDLDTLLWMANLAALEINVPLSRVSSYDYPDLVLFDLDPEPPVGFAEAAAVSLMLKDELDGLGYKSFVKTSGKKGLHVVLPVVPEYNFSQTREFVHQIGKHLAGKSSMVVSEFAQSRDPGTVFIDYMQNAGGRTMVAPYSLRATPGATFSAPVSWEEVKKGIRPNDFNINTAEERLKVKGTSRGKGTGTGGGWGRGRKEEKGFAKDPWAAVFDSRQKLG